MLPGRFSMKLNINSEKLFKDGPKNPVMLAGALILYSVVMTAAVLKSIKDRVDNEAAGK